jgi:Rod binding domain-containing protein
MTDVVDAAHLQLSAVSGSAPSVAGRDPQRIRQSAEEFESVFIAQMLRPMFSGLGAEAPFGGGVGEDIWRSMQVDEFAKAIMRSGGIGLSEAIGREMLSLQEAKEQAE